MEVDLKNGKFVVNSNASDGLIVRFLRALFWLFMAALVFAFLKPKAAQKWLQNAITYADDAAEAWGPRLKGWGKWLVDHVRDWGAMLLDGSLRLASILFNVSLLLVVFYTAGLAWAGPFAVAMAVPIGIFVVILTGALMLVPARLFPGSKPRVRDVLAVIGMWPIAIAVAIATFDIHKLGLSVTVVVILLALMYILKGGNVKRAKFAAWLVIWVGIWYQAVSVGLPAMSEQKIVGGWAAELASKVQFWNATRGKAADIEQENLQMLRQKTFGVVTDTIRTVALPSLGQADSVSLSLLTELIPDGTELEILTDFDAASWGREYDDRLLTALGSGTARTHAKKALGFVPVQLVSYKDQSRREGFIATYGTPVFYVPWGLVKSDAAITAAVGAAGTGGADDDPPYLAVSGISGGLRRQENIPLVDVKPRQAPNGGVTFKLYGRQAQGYRVPMKLEPGEAVEVQVNGSVGFNLIDGEPDPAMKGMNTGFVGPEGFGQNQVSTQWNSLGILTVSQASYGCLLWSAVRDGSTLSPAADSYGYGYLEIDRPTRYLYFVLNDIWYGDGRGGESMSLADQLTSRSGELTVTLTRISGEAEESDAAANL